VKYRIVVIDLYKLVMFICLVVYLRILRVTRMGSTAVCT